MVARKAWRQPPLTPEEEDELFMLTVADDTKDAPWMVMGDAQFWPASSLAHSLRIYAHAHRLGWYVASMLPINYRWSDLPRVHTVAPDVFVSFVAEHPRQSYNLAAEGVFPAFVLEVVSPSSVARDLREKRHLYRILGAREYVLFRPDQARRPLWGYRRAEPESPRMAPWALDGEDRLWSETLGLYLTVREGIVQAMTRDGTLLLTPEQEALARRQAEQEAAQLRAELDRIARGDDR